MALIRKRKILKKDIDQMLKVVSNSMNSYSGKLKSCIENWMPINFIVILKLLKSPKLLHVIVLLKIILFFILLNISQSRFEM